MTLAVIGTHPVQYHAPVYQALQRQGVPVTAIYGSDFSVAGYTDPGFGASFAWDTDLLSGYEARFLSRVASGGARDAATVTARGLTRTLREVAPSAVLLLGYSPRFYREAFLAARSYGAPLLFRGEANDHAVRRGRLKGLLRDTLLRTLYGSCAALLYIGQRSRAHYRRLGVPERRLFFSPYCVDTAPFGLACADREPMRAQARRELGIAPERLVVLCAGKLTAHKQPDLLLDGVRALPPALRERVTLLFLGDGPLRPDLERLAAAAPALPIVVTGFRNQRELSPFYHAGDLLALLSKSETWGLVVNEALHHGLPCVVSDAVGCAPDLIEPGVTGMICPAGDRAALVAALAEGLTLAGRAETRARCRDKVAPYSVERAAAGIGAAYELVRAGRRGRRAPA